VQPGTGGSGWVTSHAVEQSNVDLSREMTNLVTLQRNFEMSVKAFQQTDSMISQAINMRKG
jgi:flagellar hook protein FlgE